MGETSLLIANEKLKKAEADIAVLRRLVDRTIAIIVAAGADWAVLPDGKFIILHPDHPPRLIHNDGSVEIIKPDYGR